MITYDYPPLVEQDMVPKFIRGGSFGRVYQVSRCADLVAKVPLLEDELSTLVRECAIHRMLFENGISVPQPKRMYALRWDGRSKELHRQDKDSLWYLDKNILPGFVMERIRGFRLNEFREIAEVDEYDRAVELRDLELTRARERGFCSIDVCSENVLYIPNQNKVVLIDFECWEHPDLERLVRK